MRTPLTRTELVLLLACTALLALAVLAPRLAQPAHAHAFAGLALTAFGSSWYHVASDVEAADHAIFAATGELLSGHTLKHATAALAAVPVIGALAARTARQNQQQTVAHAA